MASNTDNDSQAGKVKWVMWVVSIIPLIFFSLRIYVRVHLKPFFGWDDFTGIVAVGCLIAYASVCHAAANIGLGQHIEIVEQNPSKLIQVSLLCNISEPLAIMACALGKTSFALTMLRIVVERWMVGVLWFIIISMNIVNILSSVFVFTQCKDPRSTWNPAIVSECWPTQVFTNSCIFTGSYSAAQDFVLASLPWAIVWNLRMPKKEKFGVALAMSMGIFAGAAAIIKCSYLVTLSEKADFTWELTPLLIWAAVEGGLVITAASIPTFKPLLGKFFPTSTVEESYDMLPPRVPIKKRNIFTLSLSLGETETEIGHSGLDQSSRRSIPDYGKREDAIALTTEASVGSDGHSRM